MSKPIRIQRRRTKGFNLQAQSPDGRPVVSVCRPSPWGNPYRVGGYLTSVGMVILNRAGLTEEECEQGLITHTVAVKLFRAWMLHGYSAESLRLSLYQLRGKHLACFCTLDQPCCHADVLLELANEAPAPTPSERGSSQQLGGE